MSNQIKGGKDLYVDIFVHRYNNCLSHFKQHYSLNTVPPISFCYCTILSIFYTFVMKIKVCLKETHGPIQTSITKHDVTILNT